VVVIVTICCRGVDERTVGPWRAARWLISTS
jgi:hypothetical protein